MFPRCFSRPITPDKWFIAVVRIWIARRSATLPQHYIAPVPFAIFPRWSKFSYYYYNIIWFLYAKRRTIAFECELLSVCVPVLCFSLFLFLSKKKTDISRNGIQLRWFKKYILCFLYAVSTNTTRKKQPWQNHEAEWMDETNKCHCIFFPLVAILWMNVRCAR